MTTTITQLTELATSQGLRFDADLERIVARVFKPTPKAKWQAEKMVWGYKYKTIEAMLEAASKYLTGLIESENKRKAEKEARKIADLSLAKSVQVGDVFYSSWGYEQTNVDYYQVIEKPSDQTVIVRKIAARVVKATSHDSDRVSPAKDHFIESSAPVKHRLKGDGFTITSYSSAYKCNETDTHHRSWGY